NKDVQIISLEQSKEDLFNRPLIINEIELNLLSAKNSKPNLFKQNRELLDLGLIITYSIIGTIGGLMFGVLVYITSQINNHGPDTALLRLDIIGDILRKLGLTQFTSMASIILF